MIEAADLRGIGAKLSEMPAVGDGRPALRSSLIWDACS
jgi:hypothetical protein